MSNEDILKKMQDDLNKRTEMQNEFFDGVKKVMHSDDLMESMFSTLRSSEEIDRKIEEKAKEEAEVQKRQEQNSKEHEPDINKYIVEFIDCELDIISGFEMSDYEKEKLEEFDQKIADEKLKINNKGGLAKLFSKNKNEEIKEKVSQLSKEKQKRLEEIKESHIKQDTENKEKRNEILEKISSHSKGFEGLSILSDLFEGYSEQLSENKKDLSGKMKEHNEKVKRAFPSSISIVESMVKGSNAAFGLMEEKNSMTSQAQLLIKQSDEIDSVRKLVLDKIIERPEENIESESTVGSGTKKIVKQSIGELANIKAVTQYQEFKNALKDRKKIIGHTKGSEEEIRQQFERL